MNMNMQMVNLDQMKGGKVETPLLFCIYFLKYLESADQE